MTKQPTGRVRNHCPDTRYLPYVYQREFLYTDECGHTALIWEDVK